MQNIILPQVIRIEASDRMTAIIEGHQVIVLPNHKLVVTEAGRTIHEEECDSHADAMELAEEWIEVAIEKETEELDEE